MDFKEQRKKHKENLEKLSKQGWQLLHSLQRTHEPESYKEWKEADIKKLPDFRMEYQIWYSESLAVIKQVIPSREHDFIKLYEKPKNRKKINEEHYSIEDYLTGVERHSGLEKARLIIDSIDFKKRELNPLAHELITGERSFREKTIVLFQQQLTILESAQQRFESSLFEIKKLLQANLFDSELDSATELNKKGFVRAAGAVAGVVLESHLKGVCKHYEIETTKNPTIGELNQLLQNQVDTLVWSKIEHLGRLRNRFVHKKESEPTKQNATDLIQGVSEIINTVH